MSPSENLGKPFLIISDLHLGGVPDATEESFRRFLDMASKSASGLLINGDLFEFGIAYRSVIPSKHYRVLAKIADLVDAGLPVFFTGGNHDHLEWGGHALESAGVTLLQDRTVMELAGRRTLITHGDSVCRGRPRVERRLGRSRLYIAFLRSIHPDLVARIQPYTTGTRRQVRRQAGGLDGGPKSHAGEIEAWAREELKRDRSLDLVIAGHSHLPALVEVEPGRYYLNAGDWISHFTYLEIPVEASSPQLRRWTGREAAELLG
jgi:UDP-2,3-diacylglucosamine hydrolase